MPNIVGFRRVYRTTYILCYIFWQALRLQYLLRTGRVTVERLERCRETEMEIYDLDFPKMGGGKDAFDDSDMEFKSEESDDESSGDD